MPRKYHRPPTTTTKRRKPRKGPIPYEFDQPGESVVDVDEASYEDLDEDSPLAVEETGAPAGPTRSAATGRVERHVTADYGYVRGEVIRIAAIISFLMIALIITSIFR